MPALPTAMQTSTTSLGALIGVREGSHDLGVAVGRYAPRGLPGRHRPLINRVCSMTRFALGTLGPGEFRFRPAHMSVVCTLISDGRHFLSGELLFEQAGTYTSTSSGQGVGLKGPVLAEQEDTWHMATTKIRKAVRRSGAS